MYTVFTPAFFQWQKLRSLQNCKKPWGRQEWCFLRGRRAKPGGHGADQPRAMGRTPRGHFFGALRAGVSFLRALFSNCHKSAKKYWFFLWFGRAFQKLKFLRAGKSNLEGIEDEPRGQTASHPEGKKVLSPRAHSPLAGGGDVSSVETNSKGNRRQEADFPPKIGRRCKYGVHLVPTSPKRWKNTWKWSFRSILIKFGQFHQKCCFCVFFQRFCEFHRMYHFCSKCLKKMRKGLKERWMRPGRLGALTCDFWYIYIYTRTLPINISKKFTWEKNPKKKWSRPPTSWPPILRCTWPFWKIPSPIDAESRAEHDFDIFSFQKIVPK